jgi:tetratricopeptide (TPR) repeat protein
MDHNIEREPLSLFLQQVYLKNLSGHLSVTCRDFQIALYFLEGKLVNGMSTRFDEKISVILHLMNIINEEQYSFLRGLHQFSDDQVEEILLDDHFAKKKDIFYARIYQFRRIAISVFSLQQGKWNFISGAVHPPFKEIFEIPLAGILIEGARSIDHISFYANQWFLHNPLPAKEIPPPIEVYFTDQELDFYRRLLEQSPRRTCQELIARLNMLPVDFWRKILVFYFLGLLQFQKCGSGVDIGLDIVALLEMNRKIQSSSGNIFSLLGLAPDAPPASIANARSEFLLRFSPERFGSAAAPEIKKIATDICRYIQMLEPRPDTPASRKTETLLQVSSVPKPLSRKDFPESPLPKVWDLYLQGKEFYEQREFVKAIGFLKQAIKLDPAQGDFYYLLGLSQSESEIMENDAEKNLKKAIELKSWSADPVYALGMLYRSQNKLKIAERCFQRVKEISHEHSGASRALVDLRRLRSGGKSKFPFLKKKIF